MSNCRACNTEVQPFMSFGQMPIANGFLKETEFSDEYFFEMEVAFCSACNTFQLINQPDPERMFHENYAFFTRTSRAMVAHFAIFADWLKGSYLTGENPFAVELGSNDGAMLENLAKAGIRHLGVEPSANVAAEAEKHDVKSLVAFFGSKTAQDILDEHGPADTISAANVMCHIPAMNDIGHAADILLKETGVLIFEDPYLGDVIEKTSYDQIYDEHVFLFSAHSVSSIFGPHGFELIDLLPQKTHGGSMRYVLGRKGQHVISSSVREILNKEQALGLTDAATFDRFRENCERSRTMLVSILKDLKSKGKRVVGYGATSKSTTVLNYCDIGPELIEFISDTTPIKQGKLSPGKHIPVLAYEDFKAKYPDYAVLFAWNHEVEIMANEQGFMDAGGQWVVFVPEPAIR